MAAVAHRPVLDEDLDIEGAFVSACTAANQTIDHALQRHSGSFGPRAAAPAHMNGAELGGWTAGVVHRGRTWADSSRHAQSLTLTKDSADFSRKRSDYRSGSESPKQMTHAMNERLQERPVSPAGFSRGAAMRIVTAVTRPMISAWEGYRTSLTRVRDSGKGSSRRLPSLSSHQEQAYSSRSSTK
jgi:hypothetical protein